MPPKKHTNPRRVLTPQEKAMKEWRAKEHKRQRRKLKNEQRKLEKGLSSGINFDGLPQLSLLDLGEAVSSRVRMQEYRHRRERVVTQLADATADVAARGDIVNQVTMQFDDDHGGDNGEWVDMESGDDGKGGVLEEASRIFHQTTQTRASLRRIGKSASDRIANLKAIKSITPILGLIWASGKMQQCRCRNRQYSTIDIILLDVLSCKTVRFVRCQCIHWSGRLLTRGFFPTKANPKVAISLTLLEMYQCFSTTGAGGFSKQGFAHGMKAFHRTILRREPLATYEKMFRACFPFYLRVRESRDTALYSVLNRHWACKWEEAGNGNMDAPQTGNGIYTDATGSVGGTESTEAIMTDVSPTPRIILGRPFRLELGSLSSLCAACFHRDHCDESPVILSLDGNFQHSRWIHVSPGSGDGHQTMFINVPFEEREHARGREGAEETEKEDHVSGTICEHNFKATSKPKTMTLKDETGLLMVVCRHDIPLRFLNIYAGERLKWVVFLLKKVIETLRFEVGSKAAESVILLYDVACQLSPFIRARDKELFNAITVAVNKFHGYAHEYRCQELFGAHQTPRIGQSDGEGTERIWFLLHSIVGAGRVSTAEHRMMYITNLSQAIIYRKRMQLGKALWARYKRQYSALSYYDRELGTIVGKTATNSDGVEATITEELLRSEHQLQRTYFTHTAPLIHRPYMDIYKAVVEEDECTEEIKAIDERYPDKLGADNEAYLTAIRAAEENLQKKTDAVKALLQKFKQDRDEWRVGKERYALAASLANQGHKIYEAFVGEEKARGLEAEARAKLEAMKVPPESDAEEQAMPTQAQLDHQQTVIASCCVATQKAEAKTNSELRKIDAKRSDWEPGSDNWKKHSRSAKLTELRVIYNRLLRANASRTLQMRRVKARTFSNTQAAKLLSGISSKHAAMENDVKKFNQIRKDLPPDFRPGVLTLAAFKGTEESTTESDTPGTKTEKARDALFHMHLLKSDVLGTLGDEGQSYWASSDAVRVGISHQLRRDRCREELELLKVEWERHLNYTQTLLQGLLEFISEQEVVGTSAYRTAAFELLWRELPAAESILAAAAQAQKNFGSQFFHTDKLGSIVDNVNQKLFRDFRVRTKVSTRATGASGSNTHSANPGEADDSSPKPTTGDWYNGSEDNADFKAVKEVYFAEDDMEDLVEDGDDGDSDEDDDDRAMAGSTQVLQMLEDVGESEGMIAPVLSQSERGLFEDDSTAT